MDFDYYQENATGTDQNVGKNVKNDEGLLIPLLGIAGETGTLLAEFKKKIRDKDSYEGFQERAEEELGDILWYLSNIASRMGLSLSEIASKNLQKTYERWPMAGDTPEMFMYFDEGYPPKEQLPRLLKVHVYESKEDKRAYMKILPDGVPLGNPLTDNAYDDDGYRFHDVMHLANLAVLGWSPVIRQLMDRKRKSKPKIDEVVLCNPKDKDGNNSTPTLAEAANCHPFLRRQIELVNPKIVVTLGNTALRATATIEPHNYSLSQHVRTIHSWFGRSLIPLYHPGQRAMIHRSFANQRSDYQFVAEQWRRLTQVRRASSGATRPDVMAVARYLLASQGAVTYFELHKLAYLTEYLHVRKSGRRLTSAYFIRQKDGPYCTDLEIDRIRRADGSIRIFKEGGKLCLTLGKDKMPQLFSECEKPQISEDAKVAADEAIQRYGDKNDSELKTAAYLTAPMRFMLRREQSAKVNHYNAPIDFLAAR